MGGIIRGAFVGFLLLVTLIVLMAAGMWLTSQSWINLLAGTIIVVCIAAGLAGLSSTLPRPPPRQHTGPAHRVLPQHKQPLAHYSINMHIMIENDERDEH